MKISIFSDTHCGYKFGEERGEDPFIALEEAIEKSLDCDLILIAGDIFDSRIPRPEVFARTAKILSKAQHIPSKIKLVDIKNNNTVSPLAMRGIPIVAIHGTHERRSKYMVNPIQSLEHAGLLVHLDHGTAVFEIEGKRIAVHGMSGVPERYAKDSFNQWNPKPVENAINILMLHQSIDPYIYSPLEPPSLKERDLPKGFDLYILGHMHWRENKPLHGGTLLLTGSTVTTSIHKREATQNKCIFKYDGSLEPVFLRKQRKVYWNELYYSPDILSNIENTLYTIPKLDMKPIVVFKIKGTIPKDSVPPNFSNIEDKYKNKAVIKIDKKFEIEGFKEQVEMLRMLREQRLSPEEHGLKILREYLQQANCDLPINNIFELLVQGDIDTTLGVLTG